MYGDFDFDIDKVETIVYSIESTPDEEDFNIEDYDSQEEMQEDMLYAYSFWVDFYDPFGEQLNYRGVSMDYSDVCDTFGEELANEMIKGEGIKRGGDSFELTVGVDTKPKSMSLQDVDDVAKRVLPTTEYYRGCRGFILYDGTIVETNAEHNMCSVIDGINGTFDFIRLGNVRILNQSADLAIPPTPQQRRVLAQVINSYSDTDFYLDIMDGNNASVHYYEPDYRAVLADIDRYFEEGIKPTGKLYESQNTDEVTYYRFLSETKAFLAKLLGNPIKAEPNKYLKDLGFTRSRIINLLIKKGILERNEKILTPDKTNFKKVKYSVTFKVKKKNFDRIMRRIYSRYFEKNVPQKEELNEEMEIQSVFADEENMKKDILKNEKDREAYLTRGGMKGLEECEVAGATSCTSSGQFVQPMNNNIIRKSILQKRDRNKISENKNKTDMGRKIYLTEEQFNYILKEEAMAAAGATSTSSVGAETTRGDMGYDVPAFGKSKNTKKNKKEKGTDSDFFKGAMDRKPGFSCQSV